MSSSAMSDLLSKPPVALAVGATITVGVLVAFFNCVKNPSSSKSSKKSSDLPRKESGSLSKSTSITADTSALPSSQSGSGSSKATATNSTSSDSLTSSAATSSKKKKKGTPSSNESKTVVAEVIAPSVVKFENKESAKIVKKTTKAGKSNNSKITFDSDISESGDSEIEKASPKTVVYEGPKLQSTVLTTALEFIDEGDHDDFQKPAARKNKSRAPQIKSPVGGGSETKEDKKIDDKFNHTAKLDDVVSKKEEIEQPVTVAPTIFNLKVEINTSNLARIIGKQGTTIKSIEEFTKAKVQCPKTAESGEKSTLTTVMIIGSDQSGVSAAAAIVKELNKDGHSSTLQRLQDPTYTETEVRFYESYKGLLLSCRQKIRAECEVEIQIEQEDQSSKKGKKAEKPVKVAVSGNKDNVIRAKGVLKSLKESFCSPVTHPGMQSVELDPKYLEYSGAIIGKHGDHIKNIKKKNVDVYVPKDEENVFETKNITLVGTPENLKEAIAMIDMYIERSKTSRISREVRTDNLADEIDRFGVAGAGNQQYDDDSDIEPAENSPQTLGISQSDLAVVASSSDSPVKHDDLFPELSKSTKKC